MSSFLVLDRLVLLALLGYSSSLRGGNDDVQALLSKDDITVELVITRHALSCANIVSEWPADTSGSSWFSNPMKAAAPNRYVADPILAAAGAAGSKKMASWIAKHHNEVKPDAVLSSVLVRAVETAILQYPGMPINVVPHIREAGFDFRGRSEGLDNLPDSHDIQMEKLQKAIPDVTLPSIIMEHASDEVVRSEKGNWDDFKIFLATVFLPDYIAKNAVVDNKIVLAVVTHSMFMKDAEDIKEKCAQRWSMHPKGKPLNNQAVLLSYQYTHNEETPGASAIELDAHAECTEIAPGINYKPDGNNMRPLCDRDIGDVCKRMLVDKAKVRIPLLVEDGIAKITQERDTKTDKVLQKKMKVMSPVTSAEDGSFEGMSEQEKVAVKAEWQQDDDEVRELSTLLDRLKQTTLCSVDEAPCQKSVIPDRSTCTD